MSEAIGGAFGVLVQLWNMITSNPILSLSVVGFVLSIFVVVIHYIRKLLF